MPLGTPIAPTRNPPQPRPTPRPTPQPTSINRNTGQTSPTAPPSPSTNTTGGSGIYGPYPTGPTGFGRQGSPSNAGSIPRVNPYQAAIDAATASIYTTAEGRNIDLGFDEAMANLAFGYDQAGLRNDFGANLDKLANERWRNTGLRGWKADQDLALALQRTGDARWSAGMSRGIDLDRLMGQERFLRGDRNMAGIERDNRIRQTELAARNARFDTRESAAARGASASTGTMDAFSRITQQLGLDNEAARNQYRRQIMENDRGMSNLNSDRRTVEFSYERTMRDANADEIGARTAHEYEKQLIDSLAKDYGISEAQMRTAFDLGMQRLGMENAQIVQRITQARNSNNAQAKAAADALTQQILMAARG